MLATDRVMAFVTRRLMTAADSTSRKSPPLIVKTRLRGISVRGNFEILGQDIKMKREIESTDSGHSFDWQSEGLGSVE